MKYIPLLFLLASCYTSKVAEKQLNNAYAKHPEIVAKKTSSWFPCGWAIVNMNEAEKRKVDSMFAEYDKQIIYLKDTINQILNDTIMIENKDRIKTLEYNLKIAYQNLENLRVIVKEKPKYFTEYKVVSDSAKLFQLNTTINQLSADKDFYLKKSEGNGKWLLWLLIALSLSVIINILQAKR